MSEERVTAPMLRKLFVTVSNADFAAFLTKAKSSGWANEDGKPDINGALRELVTAYSEDRIVILTPHDLKEAKRKRALEILEKKMVHYGTETQDE